VRRLRRTSGSGIGCSVLDARAASRPRAASFSHGADDADYCAAMRSRPLILAAALAALAASGCGKTVIDGAKAEKLIMSAVETQVGADVKSVVCPKDIKAKAKATFTCAVTGTDGTKGDAVVTQKDGKGNISVAAPFLHTNEAEQSIQAQVSKRASSAKVTCQEIIVVKKGGTFACEVDVDGDKGKVVGTQTDDQGSFTYKAG
jgi:hypothetical protein